MQTSGSGHASGASELTAGLAAFCTVSLGLTAANCGVGGRPDKAVLALPGSTSTEPATFRSGSTALGPLRAAASEEGWPNQRCRSR
jgi:hypothetical protein